MSKTNESMKTVNLRFPFELFMKRKEGKVHSGGTSSATHVFTGDEENLVELATLMAKGIQVSDRFYNFKTYKNVFLGSDAVRWLLRVDRATQQAVVGNRTAAIALGNGMLNAGLIEHVTHDHAFVDDDLFYRFKTGKLSKLVDLTEEEEEVRLRTLQEVFVALHAQETKFTASRVLPFRKDKYFFGVAKSYLTVYVFGSIPHLYWRYHAFAMFTMVPVQIWRWMKTKQLAYMVEYCWATSIAYSGYLAFLAMTLSAESALDGHTDMREQMGAHTFERTSLREHMGLAIFAAGVGPLGSAAVLLNNALVPHSVDHSMSLMIHGHNLVTAYCIMFKPSASDLKQGAFGKLTLRNKSLVEYAAPALLVFLAWWVLHQVFLQVWGAKNLGRDRSQYGRSSVNDMLNPPGARRSVFTKLLGKIYTTGKFTAKDRLRVLAYSLIQGAMTVAGIFLGYGFYKYDWEDGRATLAWIVTVFVSATWNGATWYSRHITGFTRVVDHMIAQTQSQGQAGGDNPPPASKKDK